MQPSNPASKACVKLNASSISFSKPPEWTTSLNFASKSKSTGSFLAALRAWAAKRLASMAVSASAIGARKAGESFSDGDWAKNFYKHLTHMCKLGGGTTSPRYPGTQVRPCLIYGWRGCKVQWRGPTSSVDDAQPNLGTGVHWRWRCSTFFAHQNPKMFSNAFFSLTGKLAHDLERRYEWRGSPRVCRTWVRTTWFPK